MSGGLGRIFKLDLRDGAHLVKNVTPPTRPSSRVWDLPERLDQAKSSDCIGFGWEAFLLAMPHRQVIPFDGHAIAAGAKRYDDTPGEDYDGTTVRGGAAFLHKELKVVRGYRWAFSAEEALNACGRWGPVVLGTDWKSGMAEPDANGLIHFAGVPLGGHCYLMVGYCDATGLVLIQNSWGSRWGVDGRAYMSYADLEQALRDAGEACVGFE